MKKVVTTITAAMFALGLTSAALAQTTQTPAKPEVKKESTTTQTQPTKSEAAKPEGAKETVKSSETKKETTKKDVKKGKTEKKTGTTMEKSHMEKK